MQDALAIKTRVGKCARQNGANCHDERPKSIRTWSGLSEWNMTNRVGNGCA